MLSKAFIFAVLFFSLVLAQTTKKDILVIDPFSPDTEVIVIVVTSTTVFPVSQVEFTQSSTILGGERDLQLNVVNGSLGSVITTGVSNGTWDISCPALATSVITMQYDGVDQSINLNILGLAGVDLTASNADSLRMSIVTDIETTYTLNVYSQNGGQSTFDLSVTPSASSKSYFAQYSKFTGNANFTNVGAIEVIVNGGVNVDTAVDLFATSATVVVSSNTATPGTPPSSQSPAPSKSPAVVGFTWYNADDDYGREPCEDYVYAKSYFQSPQNIVYYYFYRAYYYEPVIYVNSATNLAPYLFGTIVAVLLALF